MLVGVLRSVVWICMFFKTLSNFVSTQSLYSICFRIVIMADTGIFCTTAEVLRKAGANASATSSAEAYTNDYVTQAESEINSVCRYNFSDDYAALDADVKGILKQAASNLAAIYVIQYDMSGFTSRTEAEDMINVLRDSYLRALSILRDKKAQEFMRTA